MVSSFNPFEKICNRQIGSFPQLGVKIKQYLKPPPSFFWMFEVGGMNFVGSKPDALISSHLIP